MAEQKPIRKIAAVHIKANIGGVGIDNRSSLRAVQDRATIEEERNGVAVTLAPAASLASKVPARHLLVPWGAIRYVEYE